VRVKTLKPDDNSLGRWNVYVSEGKDKAERNERLSEAPEALRTIIKNHVILCFKMRSK